MTDEPVQNLAPKAMETHERSEEKTMTVSEEEDSMERKLRLKEAELRALQVEHEEYVASSCEIERELEAEVDRLEDLRLKLLEQVRKATEDQTNARATVESVNKELSKLQSIVSELTLANTTLKNDVQRLEQRNDDLERREREMQATIDDLEHQLDVSVEQGVFLRQENDDLLMRLRESFGGGPATVNPLPMDSKLKYGTDKTVNSPPTSPISKQSARSTSCGPECSLM
ncbi:hypothetical protein AeMF1_004820 [Aphanomyces euteiches]|nr:hypothetical protein AeMF1_004820 [Aphanomyces euteiches]KAH9189430.1 hypothetical protein AeNC1_008590 [Aphanomyces euteiches]